VPTSPHLRMQSILSLSVRSGVTHSATARVASSILREPSISLSSASHDAGTLGRALYERLWPVSAHRGFGCALVRAKTQSHAKAMRIVEAASRRVFGSDTHLWEAGSVAKSTETSESDLDVVYQTPTPVTRATKRAFVEELEERLPNCAFVELRAKRPTIGICWEYSNDANALEIDLVPHQAEFLDSDGNQWHVELPGKGDFQNNPVAQQVVRMVKVYSDRERKRWMGYKIEETVIEAQQESPEFNNVQLYSKVLNWLNNYD